MHYRTFDLETNGLLEEVATVHVMVVYDWPTQMTHVFRKNEHEDTIEQGIAMLQEPGVVAIAHNGIGYDFPVLEKLYGVVLPWAATRDTMVLARLVWPELKQLDLDRRKKLSGQAFPGQLIGRHSLEAWGHRLGCHKGAYKAGWGSWNQEMEDYCVQDIAVTNALLAAILRKAPSEESVLLETQVAYILTRQERYGFLFDKDKAAKLYGILAQRRASLEDEVRAVFRPRYILDGRLFTPSRDNKAAGYMAGAQLSKVKLTEFNPSSRDHVSTWLIRDFGWEPTEFTADGKPKVDDEVIAKLPYKEAAPLKEYFMVVKRIAQLAEGSEAWLRRVGKDGRLHGRVNTNGAVTGRMTHMTPNMAQVPSGRSPYGHECRELFCVPADKVQLGIDADALELRDLAGYMAIYDGGEYIKTVLEGDKSKGTDMHSVNCRALGLDPKAVYFEGETGRDIAKTWFYAFIYGAGDEKLGTILLRVKGDRARKRGHAARASFLSNLPALGKLVAAVKARAKERGHLVGLDKRILPVRSQHAALNTLLQSAGAIQMKRALCIFDDDLQALGLVPGRHYEFIANVHDEWQLEVEHEHSSVVLKTGIDAIRKAGESFGFRCPLSGSGSSGRSWNDTH